MAEYKLPVELPKELIMSMYQVMYQVKFSSANVVSVSRAGTIIAHNDLNWYHVEGGG